VTRADAAERSAAICEASRLSTSARVWPARTGSPMRTMIRLTVPGARAVSTASASGVASTVAEARIAASSSPDAAGATAICDAVSACCVIATVFDGLPARRLPSRQGGAGNWVRRAAPNPSAAAATRPIAAPV
jgi:hypothetical protein